MADVVKGTKVPTTGATRVALGDSFPLWKEAKQQFDTHEKRRHVKSVVSGPAFTYRLQPESVDVVSHSNEGEMKRVKMQH